ncbi:glutamate receptor ionotropic, delta-1-like isoform X2 [Centruroides sculpturatus]|uniref:glutamate receptor ionotropic, delta-1-like isoform X2 n=1 Tax=Centruroides sculpturatus TaxID=218467 RepID=UPI000C6D6F97|nr:glutamate receptor ionotropic, delta-1-like isoform X2 [Centruroides sculpturatus]
MPGLYRSKPIVVSFRPHPSKEDVIKFSKIYFVSDFTISPNETHEHLSFPFSTLCKYKKFRCEFAKLNGTDFVDSVEQVKNGDADITGQFQLVNADMSDVVEFTPINKFSPLQFVIKNKNFEPSWKSLISPFSFWVWLVIFLCTLVAGILIFIILSYDKSTEDKNKGWNKRRFVWFLFGSFLNQGADLKVFRRSPSRVALVFWMLPVLIICWAYGGTLTSFMITKEKQPLPKTFEELASAIQKGEFTCTAPGHPSVISLFKNSKQSYLKILYKEISSNHIIYTHDLILQGNDESFDYTRVAYIYSMVYLKISDYEIALDVTVSDDVLFSMPATFVMRKGFSHKEYFNKVMYNIFESGVQDHEIDVDMRKYNPIPKIIHERVAMRKEKESDVEPLVLRNFYGAFAILVIGYLLSFACFLVELIIGNKMKRFQI